MSERNVQVGERRWGEEKFMWVEGFSVLLTAKERSTLLDTDPKVAIEFRKEMGRFLPGELVHQTVNEPAFWTFLVGHVRDLYVATDEALSGHESVQSFGFKM